MKKERNLTTELQKEGLKALKIYNGMLIGSAVITVAGLGLMGYIAVKQKMDELNDDKNLNTAPNDFTDWLHRQDIDNEEAESEEADTETDTSEEE